MVRSLALGLWFVCSALAAAQQKTPEAPAIPADGDKAPQVLKESARHGEWVDVPMLESGGDEAASTKIHTWIVYPERREKAPVVIVIHEIFGMIDWVRGVADQLAAAGYIAVAPDLLSGKGPNGGNSDSFSGDQVRDAIRKLGRDELVRRLDAVREHAIDLPSASGKSACIGFCWGGSSTFTYATAQPELDAAVVYYGSAPTETEHLGKIKCPVLGLYGGDDARVTATVEPTKKALDELKKEFTAHVYEGAGHGFLRQQSGRDGANLKAAQQAWSETLAFLKKHLEESK